MGAPQFVLVAGEAGIGKSRLVEELLHWSEQQGIRAARTRSYAAEGALAYSPVIEWLRSETIQATLTKLDPLWRSEIARLLPEMLIQEPQLPPPLLLLLLKVLLLLPLLPRLLLLLQKNRLIYTLNNIAPQLS